MPQSILPPTPLHSHSPLSIFGPELSWASLGSYCHPNVLYYIRRLLEGGKIFLPLSPFPLFQCKRDVYPAGLHLCEISLSIPLNELLGWETSFKGTLVPNKSTLIPNNLERGMQCAKTQTVANALQLTARAPTSKMTAGKAAYSSIVLWNINQQNPTFHRSGTTRLEFAHLDSCFLRNSSV
jgi:hypothetical protein